ncbi:MAG: M23 family metallopeptidase [Desulfobacterales bacterium]|uniref:M23 family metallopeptidase n=1 Tax=Candidatus Desulfatibia profunda TaxID=2841695 RepID=A0A8J6THM2_9BACT|nr:M23 family metallopeptidase [Candidatus Desulfatibia profunda]MBL7178756.1 M23 family metallopeptidase [Desulfobacterales bacterium]
MLRFLGISFSVFLVLLTYVIYDYCHLQKTLPDRRKLQIILANQSEDIAGQRGQIQRFADEITALKSKLVALNDFEKKIRIIANIEKTADQESLFGVGGSIPDDLDTKVPLTEKHNSLIREMHEQTKQIDLASTMQKKGFESLFNFLQEQRDILSSTPAIRPLKGWVTSGFGYRISPFTGLREFHKGLDLATRMGTPIIATADGIISFIGIKGLLGRVISIDHGHGIITQYGHIEKTLKKVGDAVKRGEIIAHVGMTGRSTGPHVHYEVLLNGIPVNPEKYILN